MRRLMAPLALLLALVLICTFVTERVETICQATVDLLAQAETAAEAGNYQSAAREITAAQDLWAAHEGFLGTALRHTESDDIAVAFSPVLSACKSRDREELLPQLQSLQAALLQLYRMEKPYYFNVL